MPDQRVVVIHHVNGHTTTASFTAPRALPQRDGGGITVTLQDSDLSELGIALFAGGMVALRGVAIQQYQPLTGTTDD